MEKTMLRWHEVATNTQVQNEEAAWTTFPVGVQIDCRKSFASKKDHGKRLSQLWASSETSHTMTLWPININATKSREPWCMKVMPRMLRVARWKSMSRFASELRFAKIDSSGPSRWIRWHLASHFTTKCISSNFGVIPFPNLIDSGHAMWLFKVISSDLKPNS